MARRTVRIPGLASLLGACRRVLLFHPLAMGPFLASVAWTADAPSPSIVEPPVSLAPIAAPTGDLALIDEHRWVEAVSRRRQRLDTAPQAVVVLTARELNETPATTLPDRLRYVAGIDVYQARHGQYDVGLRGHNRLLNNRVLVIAGNREFRQEEFGSVIWRGALNVSDIARVEIAKGPSSVSYGANAFGGVIAIQERTPGARHGVHTVGSVGSHGSSEADATALGPLGSVASPFYYKVGAGFTRLEDLPGSRSGLAHQPDPRSADSGDDDLVAHRYGITLGARLPADHRVEVRYGGIDLDRWELVDDLDSGSNATTSHYDDIGARLIGPWGEASHLRSVADKTYSNQKTSYESQTDFLYTQAGFDNREDTSRAQINLPIARHHLSVGAERYRWESSSNLWRVGGRYADRSTWATVVTSNRAVFAQDQLSLGARLILTAGLRIDDHSRTGTSASPRVALNYAPDDDQFVLVSYSSGYRLPTPIETYLSEYYFRSDPGLEAESIDALELGWQRRFNEDDLAVSANAFYSRSNQQIWLRPLPEDEMRANYFAWLASPDRTTRPPGPYFAFRNLDDPADVYGLEWSARARMAEMPLSLWTNGTVQSFRYRDAIVYRSAGFDTLTPQGIIFRFDRDLGREINAPPKLKINLGATWDQRPWSAGAAVRYVSARRVFSFADSYFASPGELEVQDLDAYIALDLTLGLAWGPGRFLRLGCLDVFDSAHDEQIRSRPSTLTAQKEDQYASEIGRSVTLQGGWSF